MIAILAGIAAVLAGIGLAEALVVSRLVAAFARRPPGADPVVRPPVTVLKPLHGDEPLLEAALTTLCRQHYPSYQIVFGVQDAADPAVRVVRRLQARFPEIDVELVIDPTPHGRNHKVGNLINMMAAARHDVLVVADADVHVRPDYLDRIVAALQQPGVGLVTTLYAGLPAPIAAPASPVMAERARVHAGMTGEAGAAATGRLWPDDRSHDLFAMPSSLVPALPARLGATHITHGFLPGAVLARALGRQDCLGATMCLRRHDLQSIGGFRALVDHLADDNVLGRRINAIGLSVALADTMSLTTVPETSVRALFRHELRWARTIRALEPAGFAASLVQYPLAWALLTILLSGGALWSVGFFLIAWVLRAVAGLSVDNALSPLWTREGASGGRGDEDLAALAFCCPIWLLPLRDVLSVAVMLASYGGRQVDWRGRGLHADTPPPSSQQTVTHQSVTRWPLEGTNAR
jgi:ceramide glucosyltransferase